MNSDPSRASDNAYREKEEMNKIASRLIDEKISDDSGTEAKSKSALAPAGLKNPFWK